MTSTVDTTVKFYSSAMLGASVLSGTAGALAGVLDACLVTGFDIRSATSLVVSGSVATITYAAGTQHSAIKDSVILISGITDLTALNGEQKVTAVTSTTIKFATSITSGTASGTISFKMAPMTWTTPFTGTNLRTYKSADATSSGFTLRLDDTGTTTGRVVGYEAMTDVNTGTGAFPTATQISGGAYWWKSSAASAVATTWFVIGDTKMFYIFVAPCIPSGSAYTGGNTRGFGDPIALKPGGDVYSCMLNASLSVSVGGATDGQLDGMTSSLTTYSPRAYSGLGSCLPQTNLPYIGSYSATSGIDASFGGFPSVIDGSLRLGRRYIATATFQPPRADVPGIYYMPQSLGYDSFKTGDTAPGTGALAGKNLMVVNSSSNPTNPSSNTYCGATFFDVTGPWR